MDLRASDNDYAIFIKNLVVFTQRKKLVEIGVAYGGTFCQLCEAAKCTGGFVHGFDLWDRHGLSNQWSQMSSKEEVEQRVKSLGYENFELIKINSKDASFKQTLAQKCPSIDFAFIDGCHSYEGIKNDFVAVREFLTDDAIVVFHDTEFIDGVREFMHDLRTKYNDGTFDLMDLPYGHQSRLLGLAIMHYRKYPRPNPITEICGSASSPDEIYRKELEYYTSRLKTVDYNI